MALLASLLMPGPKVVTPPPIPNRDDTQAMADQQDALAQRKGSASDILTGSSGSGVAPGSTGRLVVGS
jgi:hypothetical protein